MDYYTKEFIGKLLPNTCGNHTEITITRGDYESMPCPLCTKDITDKQMQSLADDIAAELSRYNFDIDDYDFEDEFESAFWAEMENIAVVEYNMPYYEDMED